MEGMEVCAEGGETGEVVIEQPSGVLPPTNKVTIAVEVCLKMTSTVSHDDIRVAVERMLEKQVMTYADGPLSICQEDEPYLFEHVHCICICDSEGQGVLLFWQVAFQVYVYQLNQDGPGEEIEGNESVASFQEWLLPAQEFDGLWESLMLEKGLKQRLLRYVGRALLFAEKGVNPHLVSWNRVILLHGPPGSGKTSLCRALAQKLSIRFRRYAQVLLVEVNAHSLFSKWFSESGKLVTKLFQKIHELVEDGDTLVLVLIDEVESLAAARQAALSGSEPSDSIRAVNALLTQLDRLKSWPNVVVLTTSNITGAIDVAFVDRADIKVFIGPPSVEARYAILHSCLQELIRTGIIIMQPAGHEERRLVSYETLQSLLKTSMQTGQVADTSVELSKQLLVIADDCEGLSGRALRKLPFLAHTNLSSSDACDLSTFVTTLHTAVLQEHTERNLI